MMRVDKWKMGWKGWKGQKREKETELFRAKGIGFSTDCESMPNQLSIQEFERNISIHDSLSVNQSHP